MAMSTTSKDITWHHGEISEKDRRTYRGHAGAAIWLTGFSGSGKSTVAYRTEALLSELGMTAYVLDGDNLRHGLNSDLGFSPEDRKENIRRIGHVARLFVDAGVIVLCSFVSPYRRDRDRIRQLMPQGRFFEAHVNTPLSVCEKRDPKGLYGKARKGEIKGFTGLDAPYEAPETPELLIPTHTQSIDDSAQQIADTLRAHGVMS